MRRMGLSANTFYRRVREYEAEHGITEPTSACFFISVLILFCFCFSTKSIGDDLGLTVLSDERKRPSEPSEPAERKNLTV